ncbi:MULTISPECIES: DUF4352 domain-containing protein [unclassified Streptomyces]|uniref:DUF4352 domain-containing protein n=1 Tax=unclassified Streptomyces TaxID=2593676 RepID=UPI0035DB27B1
MSQPQYGPPQPQPPAWGAPPGHPGPYGPPPPKRGLGAGAIVAIVLGSILGLLVLVGILGATLGDSSTGETSGKTPSKSAAPAPEKSSAPAAQAPKEQPAADVPVVVTAAKTTFKPSVLHDGSTAYTSVKVTIRNNGKKKIGVNPLYFAITDKAGEKHAAELGQDEQQIDTIDLAPGESLTGVITGEGKFEPSYVTYTDGMFGDGIRGNVK